jgi:hypothetical protein
MATTWQICDKSMAGPATELPQSGDTLSYGWHN